MLLKCVGSYGVTAGFLAATKTISKEAKEP
jgi:hypothetical protein